MTSDQLITSGGRDAGLQGGRKKIERRLLLVIEGRQNQLEGEELSPESNTPPDEMAH